MNFNLKLIIPFLGTICFLSCNNNPDQDKTLTSPESTSTTMTKTDSIPDAQQFEGTIDGQPVKLYQLHNNNGASVAITNYGGRVVSLKVKDAMGQLRDVAIGLRSLKDYQQPSDAYFGALVGRYGNRIGHAKFSLDGKEYALAANNGPNTLHGGKKGYQAVVWKVTQQSDSMLLLTYRSADMDEGFPGNLDITVTYTLTSNDELSIAYEARTDKKTVVNLTNHTYFNLNGEGSGDVLGHVVTIYSDKFTPVDSTLIPTGALSSVTGTAFDFTKPTAIGAHINDQDEQLKHGKGYDHNWVLRGTGMKHAATVRGEKSGIVMNVYTSEPGLQFYTGNFMAGKNTMKGGAPDTYRNAFCMETQHFPDSPNKPQFPSTVLEPGKTYSTKTIYAFSVDGH